MNMAIVKHYHLGCSCLNCPATHRELFRAMVQHNVLSLWVMTSDDKSSPHLPLNHALISVPIHFLLNYCCCLLTGLSVAGLRSTMLLKGAAKRPCPAPAKILPAHLHRGFQFSTQSPAGCGMDSLTSFYIPAPQDPFAQAFRASHSSPYCVASSV